MVKEGKKRCSRCNRLKGIHLYYKNKTNKDGYQAQCKSCSNKYSRREAASRTWRYNDRYGITLEEYEAMLETQGGVCYICGMRPAKKRLAVDHDHAMAKIKGVRASVRGLLCGPCNRFLGRIRDDVGKADRVREYLERKRPYA